MEILHIGTLIIQQRILFGSLVMECQIAPVTRGVASGRMQISMAIFPTGRGCQQEMLLLGGVIMMVMLAGKLLRSARSLAIQAVTFQAKAMSACWNAITEMVLGWYQSPGGMHGISEHRTA